jgi:hypothetical protein
MKYLGKKFSTYPWHSINIVPHAALVMTYNDEEVPTRYGTMLELVLFGQVFHLDLPLKLNRSYSTSVLGPFWSKRRKMWYTVPMDELK